MFSPFEVFINCLFVYCVITVLWTLFSKEETQPMFMPELYQCHLMHLHSNATGHPIRFNQQRQEFLVVRDDNGELEYWLTTCVTDAPKVA